MRTIPGICIFCFQPLTMEHWRLRTEYQDEEITVYICMNCSPEDPIKNRRIFNGMIYQLDSQIPKALRMVSG